MNLVTVALSTFLVLAGGGFGALIIAYISRGVQIVKLEHALQIAMTALQREFVIPESQVQTIADAVSSKITYTGVKH